MKRNMYRLIGNQEGGVFFLIAIMLVVVVAVGGMGVDFGRAQLVKHKMQQAVDAAALAGALSPEAMSAAEKHAQVHKFFALNFRDNFMQSEIAADNLNIQFIPDADDPEFVEVWVDDVEPTYFIKLLGFTELPIRAETRVSYVGDRNPDLDVVIVVDVSGSMESIGSDGVTRIGGLRNASQTIVDLLFKDRDNEKSRVAIITYNHMVDIATNLTNDHARLTNIISGFSSSGATAGGPAAQAAAPLIKNPIPRLKDGEAGETRAFIFLTDGTFNVGYDPNFKNPAESQQLFRSACNELSASDVLKFTISFGDDNDWVPPIPELRWSGGPAIDMYGPIDKQILQDCVDNPAFYSHAATSEELEEIFKEIFFQLRRVRIVK